MTAFICAGAGFLLSVLWFDLMFDTQIVGKRAAEPPEDALASIAGYYRRVTTTARPMTWLIAAVMLATVAAIVVQIVRTDDPTWLGWTSLALALTGIALAAGRTVPNAVRLGSRIDPPEAQGRLARSILRDHLISVAAIGALLVIQLAFG